MSEKDNQPERFSNFDLAVEEAKPRLKEPPLYRVVVLFAHRPIDGYWSAVFKQNIASRGYYICGLLRYRGGGSRS